MVYYFTVKIYTVKTYIIINNICCVIITILLVLVIGITLVIPTLDWIVVLKAKQSMNENSLSPGIIKCLSNE